MHGWQNKYTGDRKCHMRSIRTKVDKTFTAGSKALLQQSIQARPIELYFQKVAELIPALNELCQNQLQRMN